MSSESAKIQIYLKDQAIDADPDNVMVTSGAPKLAAEQSQRQILPSLAGDHSWGWEQSAASEAPFYSSCGQRVPLRYFWRGFGQLGAVALLPVSGLARLLGCRHRRSPPAAALMRADAIRVLVLLRPTIARLAPSAVSASAAANPMPLVAPVIRICLSFTAQQSKALATRG